MHYAVWKTPMNIVQSSNGVDNNNNNNDLQILINNKWFIDKMKNGKWHYYPFENRITNTLTIKYDNLKSLSMVVGKYLDIHWYLTKPII